MQLHRENLNHLAENYRYSRAIWLDVEKGDKSPEGYDQWSLVARGWDRVLNDAKESEATEAEDRKNHKPALFWNDDKCAARRFVVAEFDDETDAKECAAYLLGFYAAHDKPITDRMGPVMFDQMATDAALLVPYLIAIYGHKPDLDKLQPGRIGSHADYVAGKWRKRKVKGALPAPSEREAAIVVMAKLSVGAKDLDPELQAKMMELLGEMAA